MARPAREIAVIDPAAALVERAESRRQEQDVALLTANRTAALAPLLMQVGRMQGLRFMAQIADTATAQIFSEVRSSRAHIGVPYHDAEGFLHHTQDMDEFCKVFLGRSYRRCAELADQVHLLGPELYETAQEVGFRSRDYRALKALPADDQSAVRAALEESKDTALEVLSSLLARHTQAREAAERGRVAAESAAAETRKDYEAATAQIGEQMAELRRYRAGEMPLPRLDAEMAQWGPAGVYQVGEARAALAQVASLIGAAAAMDPPDLTDADACRAYGLAMAAFADPVYAGLLLLRDICDDLLLQFDTVMAKGAQVSDPEHQRSATLQ